MARLYARPTSIFSWDFEIRADHHTVVRLGVSWFRERGHFTDGSVQYQMWREGWLSGNFVLAGNSTVLASATKTALVRRFHVRVGQRQMTLEAVTPFTRRFRLVEEGRSVGEVVPDHPFTRRCTADFPDDLPHCVQVFLLWLALLMWRRAARSSD